MPDVITFILLFVAVTVIAAIVFVLWVTVALVRAIARSVGRVVQPTAPQGPGGVAGGPSDEVAVICPRSICRERNPSVARFCRRCGSPMPAAKRVTVRRAAVW